MSTKTLPITSGFMKLRQYPAETAVRIWKLLPRRNVSEAATSPSRWDVSGNACETLCQKYNFKNEYINDEKLLYLQIL